MVTDIATAPSWNAAEGKRVTTDGRGVGTTERLNRPGARSDILRETRPRKMPASDGAGILTTIRVTDSEEDIIRITARDVFEGSERTIMSDRDEMIGQLRMSTTRDVCTPMRRDAARGVGCTAPSRDDAKRNEKEAKML